jgi:hypothetical protein
MYIADMSRTYTCECFWLWIEEARLADASAQ